MYNMEKIGCDLCCFRFDIDGKYYFAILQFDYKLKGFREQSNYKMTYKYGYNGKTYDRTKPANFTRYYKVLSMIPIDIYKKAYKMFV